MSIGLYIDFPFCIARCAFCAFNIQGYRPAQAERYASALKQEIALYADRTMSIASLYLGGGTPTRYPAETLNEIVHLCYSSFDVQENAEVTLEVHPATVNAMYLKEVRAGGINRLSIGAQSFSDARLTQLRRNHTVAEVYRAVDAAHKAGFENIGMDLIYALPGQSLEEWEQTVQAAISLDPTHLSLYGLSIEEGTLFHKQGVSLPPEEDQIAMYQMAQQMLHDASFIQYEISNFAKAGYASTHNLRYWDRHETLGIGLSAHSYINHQDRANTDSLSSYCEQIEAGRFPVTHVEPVDFLQEQADKIIFGLRKTEGIPKIWLSPDRMDIAASWIDAGLLAEREDRVLLTPKGMLMADEAAVAFL